MRAKRDIAGLFAPRRRRSERADALAAEAAALERRLERFWLPERRFYSMGLDGDGRASAALASNQGHALWAAAVRARARAAPCATR